MVLAVTSALQADRTAGRTATPPQLQTKDMRTNPDS